MYKIIQTSTTSGLTNLVEKAIKDGWKCQGGLQISYITYAHQQVIDSYMQAMVKDAEVKQVL